MNVYSYFGHAGDICISSGKLKVADVPKGNMYVTRSGCGLVAMVNHSFGSLLVDTNTSTALFDPRKKANKQTIEQFLGGEVEVHKEGDDIVESMYNPLGLYKHKSGKITIFLSGLRNMNSFKNFPVKNGKLQYEFQHFEPNTRVPKQVILQSFEGAIYPTKATVAKTFTSASYSVEQLDKIAEQLRKPVLQLMKQYPGIHYNLLCRSIHETCKKAAVDRRLISASKYGTQFDTLKRTLLLESNVKDIEAFIKSLPTSFYDNINIGSLYELQKELPMNRKKYITQIIESIPKKVSKKKETRKLKTKPIRKTLKKKSIKSKNLHKMLKEADTTDKLKQLKDWLQNKLIAL